MSEIQYLDFELTIEKSAKDKYVMRAEFGDKTVEATFTNPFNKDKREIINSTLTAAADDRDREDPRDDRSRGCEDERLRRHAFSKCDRGFR